MLTIVNFTSLSLSYRIAKGSVNQFEEQSPKDKTRIFLSSFKEGVSCIADSYVRQKHDFITVSIWKFSMV